MMDRHARSRRRRLDGPMATPPSAPPRRRGRIDPMGRMWPVGDDHATTGGSPRVAPWGVGPTSLYHRGPTSRAGERLSPGCGLRLFGSQSLMAAPRLVPSASAPSAIGRGRSEVCWTAAATSNTWGRSEATISSLSGGLLVRLILGLAAWQACSVAVHAACESHRVKHKMAVITEQPRNSCSVTVSTEIGTTNSFLYCIVRS